MIHSRQKAEGKSQKSGNREKSSGSFHPSSRGFTLIEVIVAMAILGISLVFIMQLFSAGLKSAKASCDYTIAIVHAKDKMEELSQTLGNDNGTFEDGFKWEMDVQDYKQDDESGNKLKKLIVKILWPDTLKQQKSIEMVSLKMITGEEKL